MRWLIAICAALAFGAAQAQAQDADPAQPLARAETHFLDYLDAAGAVGIIDSGFVAEYAGRDRAAWEGERRARRDELAAALAALNEAGLTANDTAALAAMRRTLAEHDHSTAGPGPAALKCADASRSDLDYAGLRAALVACFRELGNNIPYQGTVIDRVAALQLLHVLEKPEERMLLFDSFAPLWDALNGGNRPDSPWRRMIRMAADEAAKSGSEIDAAARAVGVTTAEVERWLLQILKAWRDANPKELVEPWDYRHSLGVAERRLAARIVPAAIPLANDLYYRDLGADLRQLGVVFDSGERPDKSPFAYCDFLRRGRNVDGEWQPTVARVVGRYGMGGGLGTLNELVHESGHAAHISAIRNRPAFMDWPDTLFTEAFADVPGWSVYERAWQQKYLGAAANQKDSLRLLFGLTALDVAWSLFELRMLRAPETDPNRLWTEITSEYLRVRPHPEYPWWALRVQLASNPGYMVNYGLGAVLTAEMRAKTRGAIGPFDAGNAGWYGWLSERLLRHGSERDTLSLMQDLLGRPPSPAALLEEIDRIR